VTTRSVRLLIAAAVASAACVDQPLPSGAPDPEARFAFAGINGKIAFASDRAGDSDVWVMEADGSNPVNLTLTPPGSPHLPSDHDPVWSPDGARIAFVSDRDQFDNSDIYVMNADGTGVVRLTNDPGDDLEPSWSPDGTRIAFTSKREGSADIFILTVDGAFIMNLTRAPSSADFEPAWSPDGSKIAFTTDRDGSRGGIQDIFVMNADGTGPPMNLTDNREGDGSGLNRSAAWSPDGRIILFSKTEFLPEGNQTTVWMMDGDDGEDQQPLTDGGSDLKPAWSPDGQHIAFTRAAPAGPAEIIVMNLDGSGQSNLTNHTAHDEAPDWQPAGADLAIMVAVAPGTEATRTFPITVSNRGPMVATGVVVNVDLPADVRFLAATPSQGTCSDGATGTVVCTLLDLAVSASATIQLDVRVMGASTVTITASVASALQDPDESNNKASASVHPRNIAQLAFHSHLHGFYEIYVMNADGTGVTRLTHDRAVNQFPVWSPDGSRIAYTHHGRDGADIVVINAGGTGRTNLTATFTENADGPVWSPDGSRILFSGGREIFVMNADGSGVTNLTNLDAQHHSYVWSPDGSRIAFARVEDFNSNIYVMNADGTGQVRLTSSTAEDTNTAWSPDGSRIAFSTFRDGNWEIYVMNPDGTAQTNITNHPETDFEPAWSPDGRLVFRSHRHGNAEIHVMNADGSGQKRLTTDPQFDQCPTWSANGRDIAFTRTGSFIDIYVMSPNGKNQTNLTNSTTVITHGCPSWRP